MKYFSLHKKLKVTGLLAVILTLQKKYCKDSKMTQQSTQKRVAQDLSGRFGLTSAYILFIIHVFKGKKNDVTHEGYNFLALFQTLT